MAAPITLDAVQQVALQVKQNIEARNDEQARSLAKGIFHNALEIVGGEVRGLPLYTDDKTVFPVVVDLQEALMQKGFHGHEKFLKAVSKAYRIFIELAWYQAWRVSGINKDVELRVPDELRSGLIKNSQDLESLLRKTNLVATRFELRCARQGARRLKPTTSAWQTYLGHIANLTAAGIDLSATAIWEALKGLVADVKRDNPTGWKLWYQKAHVLQWGSIQVQTLEDFNRIIPPELVDECKKQGGNLSICLTKVLMDLIKRDDVDHGVKEEAFNLLKDIISWERPTTFIDLAKYPSELAHKLFRKADRFWESRDLAIRYLARLATKEKYVKLRDESLEALKARRNELREEKSKRYDKEKVRLRKTLINVGRQIESLDPKKRGGSTDNELLEKLKTQAVSLGQEFKELGEDIEKAKVLMPALLEAYNEMDKNESDLISSLLN